MVDSVRSQRPGPAARYGIDAPYVPAILGVVGTAGVVMGLLSPENLWLSVVGAVFIVQALVYLHTTLRGKFRAWQGLLDRLNLRGEERILDLGCGRGAVLIAAAHRLPRGEAHGIDLWRSVDQSGNDEATTWENARREGVEQRVKLHTGDMRVLAFPDGSFDVVVSSLAIHNLRTLRERFEVLDEALRVLRPGGSVVIADIRSINRYAEHLRHIGAVEVTVHGLGPGFWFGGPWQAAAVVTALKP